ncbi:hypothetical protein CYMTET_13109 [Cymbomonas tetramitiformis]|uniref:Uncharacterized protein n=1 Tax=Cymbomonas tetramitiformis TaxID=36881 RepID=A0AAE0LBI4_9CHLO|nr:hypothetical protein CYMTET_13109 [Cymbomonas tetramitiformis]
MMRAAVKRRDVDALDEMMFEGWPIDAEIVKLALTGGDRRIVLRVTGYIRFDVAWKRNSEFVRDVMRAYSEASRYAPSTSEVIGTCECSMRAVLPLAPSSTSAVFTPTDLV